MHKVTQKQIQLIHVAKSKLNIDDDTYKEMLKSYNVKSSKDLTYRQATRFINALKKSGFNISSKTRPPQSRRTEVSLYQLDLIQFLASQYPWRHENGFHLWLAKQNNLLPFGLYEGELMWSADAAWVIEKLKQMTNITRHEIAMTDVKAFTEWKKENPNGQFKEWKACHEK